MNMLLLSLFSHFATESHFAFEIVVFLGKGGRRSFRKCQVLKHLRLTYGQARKLSTLVARLGSSHLTPAFRRVEAISSPLF